MPITARRSTDRGHANHGWLDSYHTFSFANYQDPKFEEFGCLRVINEDRVAPSNGFPTHPHRGFEIFSYVVSGALKHKDSLGHEEVIKRGEVQFTSAGTGLRHSEYNNSDSEEVHFLQIWATPKQDNTAPSYQTKSWTDADKENKLAHLIAPLTDPNSENQIHIRADLHMYASLLHHNNSITHQFTSPQRKGYVHVAMTGSGGSLKLNEGVVLSEGDGAFVTEEQQLTFTAINEANNNKPVEFIFFDLV